MVKRRSVRHKLNYHIYNIALAFCKIQIRTAEDESLSNYKTGDHRSPLRIERGKRVRGLLERFVPASPGEL